MLCDAAVLVVADGMGDALVAAHAVLKPEGLAFVVLDEDEWRLPAALVEDAVREPSPRP